jgi:adenine-specific DNA-methyltransferase
MTPSEPLSLFEVETGDLTDSGKENPDFLSKQLITYIGNKRSLLPTIDALVRDIRGRLGGRRISSLDLFAGSGAVARLLRTNSHLVAANDLEGYSRVINSCYLSNVGTSTLAAVEEAVARLNKRADSGEWEHGFIRDLYAPADEQNITTADRVFYTVDNARRLDSFAMWIAKEPEEIRHHLLAPLMSKASVHTNTAGVFKGFYKDSDTGAGQYGGKGRNALTRILGQIRLEAPVRSNFETDMLVFQEDAVSLVETLPEFDFAYVDPPYNQHPYGANYFMLNYLHDYQRPESFSRVSGIPTDWNRSDFNKRARSLAALSGSLKTLSAKFILISFNDEGFISPESMREVICPLGKVSEISQKYNTYRGSRNLRERSLTVTEHLFLLEKS